MERNYVFLNSFYPIITWCNHVASQQKITCYIKGVVYRILVLVLRDDPCRRLPHSHAPGICSPLLSPASQATTWLPTTPIPKLTLHLPALRLNHFLPTPLTSVLPSSFLLQHQSPRNFSLLPVEARSISVSACLLSPSCLACSLSCLPSASFLVFTPIVLDKGTTLKSLLSLESAQLPAEAEPA